MARISRGVVVGGLLLTFSGCSGDDAHSIDLTGPTGSTAVATVTSLKIVPDLEELRIGEARAFALVAELSQGVPPGGPLPRWTTSNPRVVAIDGAGVATGIAQGRAVIQVEFRGARATRILDIVRPTD